MKYAINVGIIGFGVVGSGAVKILVDNCESIALRVGLPVRVKKIADLDITTPRPVKVDPAILTTNVRDILDDPEIDVVVETIGGVKPAGDFIKAALEAGKNVVTANKELIAKQGNALLDLATKNNLDFMFEASVGGGIPIINPMKTSLAGNEILQVKGIVNGTTNYILTRMREEGVGFEEVLKDAQAKGYAEADPTADVEGFDAAYKLCILASIAFNSRVDVNKVHHEGITRLQAADMAYAEELGYVIKLLAIATLMDGDMQLRVHPTFLPKRHPLAGVNDVNNAILVRGNAVGEVMFYGPGAGSEAAGSAVVGDILDIARNIRSGSTGRVPCTCFYSRKMLPIDRISGKNYVRVIAEDKPRVLASIATEFANHNVSIESVLQKVLDEQSAEIVWLTHNAAEPDMQAALTAIRALPVTREVANWIRVES